MTASLHASELVTAPNPAASQPGSIIVHVFGRTDVGRTREHNEDAFVVADLTQGNATLQPEVRTHTLGDRGTLFMVADGMGGAAAGEIASAMAIEVVLNELMTMASEGDPPDSERFATAIKRAAAAANVQIHQFALEHPEYRGMGTTATAAGLLGDTLYLAQVGDSRAYLVRNGAGQQITKDQSLMQKLIEAGEITEEEAELSERRNIILQALGPESSIKVDLTFQKIRIGDTLIICSDGLSGQVRADEIARVASEEPDLMQVCKRLIDRANENGGPDNITVIAARFEGSGLERPSQGDNVGHHVFPLPTDTGPVAAASRPTLPAGASSAPTVEAEVDRSTLKMPSMELPVARRTPLDLSAERQTRGSMISRVLLVLLIAGAAWVAYNFVSKQVAQREAPPVQATSP